MIIFHEHALKLLSSEALFSPKCTKCSPDRHMAGGGNKGREKGRGVYGGKWWSNGKKGRGSFTPIEVFKSQSLR